MKNTIAIIVLTMLFITNSVSQEVKNGKELIQLMHNRYDGKWYNAATFEQETILYEKGKQTKKQIWYEAFKIPGKLIIKFDSVQSGDGLIFNRDSVFVYKNDSLLLKKRRLHDLLILSLDVYNQPIEKTISDLNELGYNLDKIHINTWQGKNVYVVGALQGDTTSTQFWIEKEKLLFVRMIGNDHGKRKEVIFNDYKPLGQAWIEYEVIFKMDNNVYQKENYSNVKIPTSLNDELFNTENFKNKKW